MRSNARPVLHSLGDAWIAQHCRTCLSAGRRVLLYLKTRPVGYDKDVLHFTFNIPQSLLLQLDVDFVEAFFFGGVGGVGVGAARDVRFPGRSESV